MVRAEERPPDSRVTIRQGKVGDLGWTFHRQAVVYKTEFGYGDVFETYLAQGLAPFLDHFDASRDRLWVAEMDGRAVGFVAVHHADERPGWAKLRWFLVEKEARGHGVGSRLMREAVDFSRRAGYAGLFLWTVDDLHAARRQYEKAGFVLAEEKEDCPWATWGREQRWELTFET